MKNMKMVCVAVAACLVLVVSVVCGSNAYAGPNPVVIMETSEGRIILMLYPKDAPKTVANFLRYVDSGFYDKTIFHRVIRQRKSPDGQQDGSMNIVQGGGYTYPIKRKRPMAPIVNEAATGLLNAKGTIAMARTDNPDSATSEFFFNVEDNPVLDYKQTSKQIGTGSFTGSTTMGYCAFGKVIRGMDVVVKIHQAKTGRSGGMSDVPAKPIILKKAYRPQ
ncbi:peptidylprolyl isomerase [Pseudodesulfovibrio sp. JC047]|uniref:peptidylprolyl isomerase n=1 Tax=Pseudodesulfovibrio sp. JC047 TaxID=2683199 RepID=UPI0013D23665|nr:peptidylprolyl isomerase [Pseudodesulfovibrio sp. JC047]NDV20273.1 peptidylprolyl isomerase [Pseudodesulfovibrio sp. JC047]